MRILIVDPPYKLMIDKNIEESFKNYLPLVFQHMKDRQYRRALKMLDDIDDLCGSGDTFTIGLPFITIQVTLGDSWQNSVLAISGGSVYQFGISYVQSTTTGLINLPILPPLPPTLPPSGNSQSCPPNPDPDGFYCSPY